MSIVIHDEALPTSSLKYVEDLKKDPENNPEFYQKRKSMEINEFHRVSLCNISDDEEENLHKENEEEETD